MRKGGIVMFQPGVTAVLLRAIVAAFLCAPMCLALSSGASKPDTAAKWARDMVVVVTPEEPSPVQFAAQDLAHYLQTMLGEPVQVCDTLPEALGHTKVFLVATPASCPSLPAFLAEHLRADRVSDLGTDGCFAAWVPPVLLLGGNTGRGAANAVWTYIEEFCHVGFFWSGDQVPQLDTVPFREAVFRQIPRFAERYMASPGGYSLAEYMDWEDWKREIDWRVHKRQNMMSGPEREFVWRQVYADLEGKECVLSEIERQQDELRRKIAEYARARGLMLVMPGFLGEVPAAFVTTHPNLRYVGGTRWGEVPMDQHIHPADPMFHELSVRFIRAYTERYGPAEFYFVPPYPEAIPEQPGHVFGAPIAPGSSPTEAEKVTDVRVELARAVHRVLQEACPEVTWLADSWAFMTAEYWTPEAVQMFCDAVVDPDHFRIYDTWGEERPMWTLHNAFWGKKWTLGVLHCFGGNTTLRGDLYSLVRDIQRVGADPQAKNCMGIYLVPECEHHNDLYFDLAMCLAWNSGSIPCGESGADLSSFLNDYARRRYGDRSAARMAKVLGMLARTVYASKDMTQPLYLHQLYTTFDFPNASVYAPPEQVAQACVVRRAIRIALAEASRQEGNPLFERDVVDMARRYLGDVFNGTVPNVIYAWRARDSQRFEQAAADALTLLSLVENLLAASPQYRLETRFRKARTRPDFEQLARQTRNVVSIWEGRDDLLDYVRRDDLAELIHGYYLPRLESWIDRLRTVGPDAWSEADYEWLSQSGKEIGRKWVAEGVTLGPPPRPAAAEVRRAIELGRGMEARLLQVTREASNPDFSRGLDGWSLSARRMKLVFEPDAEGGSGKILRFETWPGSSGGNLYLFQTVKSNAAEITLDVLLDKCGESGFAGLRVEGYDAAFHRVVECTYQWGDARNYWPDRYRPDDVTPEWSVGATGFLWWWVGHYTIKERFGAATGKWEHLEVRPAADVDRVHGAGTWGSLGVRTLRIALVASSRRVEDPVAGSFARLHVATQSKPRSRISSSAK